MKGRGRKGRKGAEEGSEEGGRGGWREGGTEGEVRGGRGRVVPPSSPIYVHSERRKSKNCKK